MCFRTEGCDCDGHLLMVLCAQEQQMEAEAEEEFVEGDEESEEEQEEEVRLVMRHCSPRKVSQLYDKSVPTSLPVAGGDRVPQ